MPLWQKDLMFGVGFAALGMTLVITMLGAWGVVLHLVGID